MLEKYLILNIYFNQGPICDNMRNLFVTTLGAKIFNLDSHSGLINWSLDLDKPIFTSPILNESHTAVFFGTCGCLFYKIDFEGKIVGKFFLNIYNF